MKTFAIFPPEVKHWALQNGWPEPPRSASPLCDGNLPNLPMRQDWLSIIEPREGAEYKLDPLIKNENEMIFFEASAGSKIENVSWYVNGKKVGEGTAPDFVYKWMPTPGDWTIEARSGNQMERVHIRIVQ
jgi:hypothetical protein